MGTENLEGMTGHIEEGSSVVKIPGNEGCGGRDGFRHPTRLVGKNKMSKDEVRLETGRYMKGLCVVGSISLISLHYGKAICEAIGNCEQVIYNTIYDTVSNFIF